MKWQESTLFAIDTETTGLDPEKDRIVELGACKFDPTRGPETSWARFGTLINPGIPIPQEASEIHGITDEMVAGKPALEDIAERFLCRVAKADVLCGYNYPFDESMLRAGLQERAPAGDHWDLAVKDKPVLDPLVLVRLPSVGKFWPGKGRHKLDAVARKLGIPRKGHAHRASSDAELAIRILLKLGEQIVPRHLSEDAHEASEQIARWRTKQDEEFQAWLSTQEEQRP